MADLVTHLCTALLPAAFLPRFRMLPVLTVGVVLPDLVTHVPSLSLELVHRHIVSVPDAALYPWPVLHVPAGMLLVCALLAWAFPRQDRRAVFGWLFAGGLLHLFVDLLQDHHGLGYYLLVPLSRARFELGWIGSEATTAIAIPLAVVTALAWAVRLRLTGVSSG